MNREDMFKTLEDLNEVLREYGQYRKIILGGSANVILPQIYERETVV